MNKLFCLSLTLFSVNSHANVWDGSMSIEQNYACLGIDGVPIAMSGQLAADCCENGGLKANAPATCKAGFQSITGNSGLGASGGIQLAQQQLEVASTMSGNSLEDNNTPLNLGGTNLGTGSGVSAASVGGTGGLSDTEHGSGAGTGNGSSGTVHGGTGSFGGGSGTGLALGNVGGTTGIKGEEANNNQGPSGGGYVKAGDGAAGKGGKGGSDSGMFGSLFGGSGGGAGGAGGGDGAAGKGELSFGDGANGAGGANGDANAANGGSGSGDDGDGKGSAEDPSDYFNRIDKSANIFKVVSARYLKKKHLFVTEKKI